MSLNLAAAYATRSRGPHSQDHGRFYRPWKSSDLILKVADREFHVHRTVLMLCSPVFEAMLSLEFKEKSAQKIPLPGKDATEIEQMLQGIYPDQDLWISKENCLFLLKLSTEYQIDRLKTRCEEYLSHWCEDGMNIDEAMELIIVSQRYSVEEWIVKRWVDRFVSQTDKTWEQLQKHKRFSELEPSIVKQITEKRMAFLERRSNIGFSFVAVSSSRSCRKYGPVNMRNNFRV